MHGYDYHTIRMLAGDRYTRRADEAATERLGREARGATPRRVRRLLEAAWSGVPTRLRSAERTPVTDA
jgi:hypothetical protein